MESHTPCVVARFVEYSASSDRMVLLDVGLREDSCCILHLALAACPNLPRRRTPSTSSDKPAPRMIKMTNQQTEFGHATQVTIMGQRLGLGLGLGLG